jgi:hypothetical protein
MLRRDRRQFMGAPHIKIYKAGQKKTTVLAS